MTIEAVSRKERKNKLSSCSSSRWDAFNLDASSLSVHCLSWKNYAICCCCCC